MSLPSISEFKPSDITTHTDLLESLITQINKDLNMFGITINSEIDTKTAYEQLLKEISQNIEYLLKTDAGKVVAILYRVDISEKELLVAGVDLTNYSHPEIVAHSIIKREFKKVLLRKYYKGA